MSSLTNKKRQPKKPFKPFAMKLIGQRFCTYQPHSKVRAVVLEFFVQLMGNKGMQGPQKP